MSSELGIYVFGHTRAYMLDDLLQSLDKQSAIGSVELWIDGYQGKSDLKNRVEITRRVADKYPVYRRRYHNGQLGFRKMMLQAMQSAITNYDHILFLEDDCFPNRNAITTFRQELARIEDDSNTFSVYGHPFQMAESNGYCTRFQGWGWATTRSKLKPYADKLIDCYSMSEADYLEFTKGALTDEVVKRLDITPPRLPSQTLRKFFAWDETLALLCAMDGKRHKRTDERVIYNCGIGNESAHFPDHDVFRKPPFNLVAPSEVWEHF